MTSNEIRVDAQLISGFTINSATAFLWVKDAARYIMREHPLSAPRKTVEIEVNSEGQTYSATDEIVRIEIVRLKGSRANVQPNVYTCDELGNFTFYHKGIYEITYRYVAEMPNSADIAISLPDKYAEPIKYYLASQIRGRTAGHDDGEAQQFNGLFQQYIADADISMARVNKRYRRMPARF